MPNQKTRGEAATVAANEAIQNLVDSSAEVSKMLANRPGMQVEHPFQLLLDDICDYGKGVYTPCTACQTNPASVLVVTQALCTGCADRLHRAMT